MKFMDLGLENELREKIRAYPKAEYHCHLDGSVRLSTLLELSKVDPLQIREKFTHTRYSSLESYLSVFSYVIGVLQTEEALIRVTRELVEDASMDGVRYLEMRYAPHLFTANGLEPEAVIEATLIGMTQGMQITGIEARIILCAMREQDPNNSLQVVHWAKRYQSDGVLGIDLAGPEKGFPCSLHKKAFDLARDFNLLRTVHAGEADGPWSIRDAIDLLHAQRIGHGIRLIEDEVLLQQVVETGTMLEICPQSNIDTGAVDFLEVHPLWELHQKGVKISINTDNRLISRTHLVDEYVKLFQCNEKIASELLQANYFDSLRTTHS